MHGKQPVRSVERRKKHVETDSVIGAESCLKCARGAVCVPAQRHLCTAPVGTDRCQVLITLRFAVAYHERVVEFKSSTAQRVLRNATVMRFLK